MSELIPLIISILAVFTTLAFYTTLIGESNVFYTWAVHVYLGTSMAYTLVAAYNYLINNAVTPLSQGILTPLGGVMLGLLMWSRFTKNYRHLARIPIAISVGIGTGLTIRTIVFTNLIQQIQATVKPLWTGDLLTSFNNTVVIVTALCTMLFFFFSARRVGALKVISTVGEYSIFAAFGAFFAANFLGRFGLFIGRMSYLVAPDTLNISLLLGVAILAILVAMKKMNILDKFEPE